MNINIEKLQGIFSLRFRKSADIGNSRSRFGRCILQNNCLRRSNLCSRCRILFKNSIFFNGVRLLRLDIDIAESCCKQCISCLIKLHSDNIRNINRCFTLRVNNNNRCVLCNLCSALYYRSVIGLNSDNCTRRRILGAVFLFCLNIVSFFGQIFLNRSTFNKLVLAQSVKRILKFKTCAVSGFFKLIVFLAAAAVIIKYRRTYWDKLIFQRVLSNNYIQFLAAVQLFDTLFKTKFFVFEFTHALGGINVFADDFRNRNKSVYLRIEHGLEINNTRQNKYAEGYQ